MLEIVCENLIYSQLEYFGFIWDLNYCMLEKLSCVVPKFDSNAILDGTVCGHV